jgi:hypothetical protein
MATLNESTRAIFGDITAMVPKTLWKLPLSAARSLVFALALIAMAAAQAAAQSAGFVYALRQVPGEPNEIYGFSVNPTTGELTALAGFPVATGGTGGNGFLSEQMVFAAGRLHVINDGDNTLSVFRVDRTTGALIALPFSPVSLGTGAWACVTVHPGGSPVLVGGTNAAGAGFVASLVVTAAAATPAAGSPFATGGAWELCDGYCRSAVHRERAVHNSGSSWVIEGVHDR